MNEETQYAFAALCLAVIHAQRRKLANYLAFTSGAAIEPSGSSESLNSEQDQPDAETSPTTARWFKSTQLTARQCMEQAIKSNNSWALALFHAVCEALEMDAESEKMLVALSTPLDEGSDEDNIKLIQLFAQDVKAISGDAELALELLFTVALSNGVYDARSRTLIKHVSKSLDLSVHTTLPSLEIRTMDKLASSKEQTAKETQQLHGDEIVQYHTERSKKQRWAYMGAAAVGGGLVIGLTGGLAAPLVGAGLAGIFGAIGITGTAAFLGSMTGIALITSVFGATGAGMLSYRTGNRLRGVSEFLFIEHSTLQESDKDNAVQAAKSIASPTVAKRQVWDMFKHKPAESDVAADEKLEENIAVDSYNAAELTPPFVSITISGWVATLDDVLKSWQSLTPVKYQIYEKDVKEEADVELQLVGKQVKESIKTDQMFLNGDHFSLCWESAELITLANAVENLIRSEALNLAATEVMKRTVLMGIMTAIAWPAMILKFASVVDNPWSLALERARLSGLILADVLLQHRQGQRPVVLIGSSLGARVIFYCLLELAARAANGKDSSIYGIVESVYIMGACVAPTKQQWAKCRSVVSDRFVNCYSKSDWVLGVLYRSSGNLYNIAGIGPAKISYVADGDNQLHIENVDVSEQVSGHTAYRDQGNIEEILRKCEFLPPVK